VSVAVALRSLQLRCEPEEAAEQLRQEKKSTVKLILPFAYRMYYSSTEGIHFQEAGLL
jgi:hypothetical protein